MIFSFSFDHSADCASSRFNLNWQQTAMCRISGVRQASSMSKKGRYLWSREVPSLSFQHLGSHPEIFLAHPVRRIFRMWDTASAGLSTISFTWVFQSSSCSQIARTGFTCAFGDILASKKM